MHRDRIRVHAQIVRNVRLLALLELEDKLLLDQVDSEQRRLNEENVVQLGAVEHEFDIRQFGVDHFSVELVLQFERARSFLVHVEAIDGDELEDVFALSLVDEHALHGIGDGHVWLGRSAVIFLGGRPVSVVKIFGNQFVEGGAYVLRHLFSTLESESTHLLAPVEDIFTNAYLSIFVVGPHGPKGVRQVSTDCLVHLVN